MTGVVTVGRCGTCGVPTVPKPEFCPACLSVDVVGERHSGSGVVYAVTVVRRGPKGVDLPYGIAFVDLADDLRIMTRFDAVQFSLTPGTEVSVTEIGDPQVFTATPKGVAA